MLLTAIALRFQLLSIPFTSERLLLPISASLVVHALTLFRSLPPASVLAARAGLGSEGAVGLCRILPSVGITPVFV